MSLLVIASIALVALVFAYIVYGGLLARLLRLDPNAKTPSVEYCDDSDYIPTPPRFLISQHFSAIAAAGPIVGPILAAAAFGWLPAFLWILLGGILIGGVHDIMSLTASIRHKARSIAEVVREHMSRRSYVIFLSFIWLALVYIVVAFTDITALSFVGVQTLENGEKVSGGGIATASILYILLPILMGLTLRFLKLPLMVTTAIFLPLVVLAIWFGTKFPLELSTIFPIGTYEARKYWDVFILLYCLAAALIPMWLLLQPRGHLGGFFLYFYLIIGMLGLFFAGRKAEYPAFINWNASNGDTLAPFLFITIACGAVSGFHSLIASGTTSKQLQKETDAKPIGYGAMLMESMVAVLSLSTLMVLTSNSSLLQGAPKPNLIFSQGIGSYIHELLGVPYAFAVSLMLMAFTTFVYDTLDVCTRLGRYIIQELTGMKGTFGAWLGTGLTVGVPLMFLLSQPSVDAQGKPVQAYMVFWPLFGASNQLLAALTLLGVTVWLWRTRRAKWVWVVTGIPTLFMYVMSGWALVSLCMRMVSAGNYGPVLWVGSLLVLLAIVMMVEAIVAFTSAEKAPPQPQPAPAVT
ncbi:MAG TPA: carbon starvation CstA family protein [Fimbriimonadales bacterium]|nr:carbon starvation CstA family protein [Fimbriimonadales bacterium]